MRWRAISLMLHSPVLALPAQPLSNDLSQTARTALWRRRALSTCLPSSMRRAQTGRVQRVARTFGLLAAAGELGIACGVLPWPAGEAARAASRCFVDWLADRGGSGAGEIAGAISHLRAIIERDGASRFQRSGSSEVVHQRLGYIRQTEGDIDYMIQRESWKTLMVGRDHARRTARELAALGAARSAILEGRPDPKERLPGHKISQRVYVVRHSALFAGGIDDA